MSGDLNMRGQCPSCGGDCGRTAKSGCNYSKNPPQDPPNVILGGFGKALLTDLRNAIKAEVFKYEKRISLAEAIGILDIVKHELIEGHRE